MILRKVVVRVPRRLLTTTTVRTTTARRCRAKHAAFECAWGPAVAGAVIPSSSPRRVRRVSMSRVLYVYFRSTKVRKYESTFVLSYFRTSEVHVQYTTHAYPTHAPWARRRNHSPRYGGAPCTLKRGMLCAASSRGCCSDCCCCQQPPRHTNDHFSQDHRAAPREETRAKRNQRARSSRDELPHSSWTSGDATRFA